MARVAINKVFSGGNGRLVIFVGVQGGAFIEQDPWAKCRPWELQHETIGKANRFFKFTRFQGFLQFVEPGFFSGTNAIGRAVGFYRDGFNLFESLIQVEIQIFLLAFPCGGHSPRFFELPTQSSKLGTQPFAFIKKLQVGL